jgi:hypothetical protein
MTNFYLEQTWRNKSDKEVFDAAAKLEDFDESVHPVIKNEVARRKGLKIEDDSTDVTSAPEKAAVIQVKVVDFDMPFGSMVSFMVKWAIASIPAFIILIVLGGIVGLLFSAIFHR